MNVMNRHITTRIPAKFVEHFWVQAIRHFFCFFVFCWLYFPLFFPNIFRWRAPSVANARPVVVCSFPNPINCCLSNWLTLSYVVYRHPMIFFLVGSFLVSSAHYAIIWDIKCLKNAVFCCETFVNEEAFVALHLSTQT